MLTVHHLGVSQSERIVWLCEELELPYVLKRYDRDPVTRMAPPAYKALHPFGTAPVITDGAVVMAESGAIIEYVIHSYGKGRLAIAPGQPGYADYLFWFHFANASFMPAAMVEIIGKMLNADTASLGPLLDRTRRAYAMIEDRLGKAPYFAGNEFSAADIMMVFPLTTMRQFVPHDLAHSPNTRTYLQRIGARPAYRRAMQKGDPGMTPTLS